MHLQIVVTHNLVTETKKKLTGSKIGTRTASQWDLMSKDSVSLSIAFALQEPLPLLCRYPISAGWLAGEAICRGESLRVEQASHSAWEMNWPPFRAEDMLYLCLTTASPNPGKFDYGLVEKSLGAEAIFPGHYQESPLALQMLWVEVQLQYHMFGVWWVPESSVRFCRTSLHCHRSSRLCPPILAVSICEASAASAETSPSAAVPFWRLCPSPSRVHHLHSACTALYLNHPDTPHPPHSQNLQDRSDCLWYHSTPPDTFFQALWLSILHCKLSSYVPPPAWWLSLCL